MTGSPSGPTKPLRADAERNRAAILEAARRLLAANGLGVSLDDVAAEAGVGSATLYRRFASREELASAVLEQQMSGYADRTEADLARSQHDPWGALESHTHHVAEQQVTDRAFAEVVASPSLGSETLRAHLDRTHRASRAIVRNAVAAGAVRPDLHPSDLLMLVQSVNGLIATDADTAAEAWPRLVATFLAAWTVRGDDLPAVPAPWAERDE
ncbi:MAG: TetR/AcrR family transcriptional regulator [Aeromicrobium erythreum]